MKLKFMPTTIFRETPKVKFFDPAKEFVPQKLDQISLIKARKRPPVYWIYENNQIKRFSFNPQESKFKTIT